MKLDGRPSLRGRPFSHPPIRYRGAITRFLILALLLATSCQKDEPPSPTTEQSEQLNEAEDMLNALAENEEGPVDHSTGPSNSSD